MLNQTSPIKLSTLGLVLITGVSNEASRTMVKVSRGYSIDTNIERVQWKLRPRPMMDSKSFAT
jgi:hypothetical protein